MINTFLSSDIAIGGAAAIIAALLWAIATVIFHTLGEKIHPTELNLVKCSFAVTLMILTTLLLRESLPKAGWLPYVLLAVSGIVGIGIGDTAYFAALNQLGARVTLLLTVLAPPMAGVLSWMFLGETLQPLAWLGIFVTMGGIAWVIWQENQDQVFQNRSLGREIFFALIASLGQAIGAILSRYALTSTSISALQTAIIRLLAGILSLALVVFFFRKNTFTWLRSPESIQVNRKQLLGLIAVVGFLGTYTAIWLQQVALQYAPVGITQTLLSTSPLFILPIALIRKEKVTWVAAIGAVISILGVVLLFTAGG